MPLQPTAVDVEEELVLELEKSFFMRDCSLGGQKFI